MRLAALAVLVSASIAHGQSKDEEIANKFIEEISKKYVIKVDTPTPKKWVKAIIGPGDAPEHIKRGDSYSAKEDYRNALAEYTEAIRLDPKSAVAFQKRGDAHYGREDYEEAIADFDEAIRLDPRDANSHFLRAESWRCLKENDKAIVDFDAAIRLDPKHVKSFNDRGVIWFSRKDFDRAISDYEQAIRLDPSATIPIINRGLAWEKKREYEKALADYATAIRLDPKNVSALTKRAWILATCPVEKIRNGKQAVESATRACELEMWVDESSLQTLAAAYAETGEFTKAYKLQERAFRFAPYLDKNKVEERLKSYLEKKPYRDTQ